MWDIFIQANEAATKEDINLKRILPHIDAAKFVFSLS